jgi:macrolide transport system ATP-binding/permease protein
VDEKRDLEIVGVSANVRYGGLKQGSPMTVFAAASQFSPDDRVTYALRVAGDPLRYVRSVREIVREADSRIPVTNVFTQAARLLPEAASGSLEPLPAGRLRRVSLHLSHSMALFTPS